MALVQLVGARSPSVRPPLGTTMASPVAHFAASASNFVEIQAFFGIQI